jgi:hypothetical protein
MNVLRTMQVRISSRNITRNANHSPLDNSTLYTVTPATLATVSRPPTLHTPPAQCVWQRLEFGKLMNEAGGVLAPPGHLIHEAAGVLSRSPAHLNLERRH